MISTQQEKVFWVFDLVGEKQADCLQRLLPSVHVVAQEQVVALRGEASIFKEPEQIIVLAVDVACRGQQRTSLKGHTAAGRSCFFYATLIK